MGDASGHTSGLPRSRLRRTFALLLVRWADATTRWVARLLGESPSAGRAHLSEAELRELVAHNTVLDRDERQLINHVLTAGDRQVRALMVPRTEVTFLDAAAGVEEAAKLAVSTRHSRFPVMDTNRDDVIGFVHLRDLLVRPDGPVPATVAELLRPLHRIPASKRVLAALSEMRRSGDQVALVVDEYGGTAGIVTLEDLLEELVGEIRDEYDAAPEAVEGAAPAEVDGLLNLPDFAERAGFALPPGPYDTVGGFIMAALGRLPVRGDEVRVASWRLTVSDMDGRRVARVALAPVPAPAAPSAQVELLPGLAVG
jgi:putative hemolysin